MAKSNPRNWGVTRNPLPLISLANLERLRGINNRRNPESNRRSRALGQRAGSYLRATLTVGGVPRRGHSPSNAGGGSGRTILSRGILAIAALAGLLAAAQPSAAAKREPVRVSCLTPGLLDGDTIADCGGERVRLFGLDAPERFTPAGPAATRALANLTRGKRVECIEAGPRSHGRLVARCFAGGRDLTCEMIRLGVAVEWVRFSKGYYRECGR